MINELKETHNQNVDQQHGFHHLLDEMKIPYQEDEFYLNAGEIPEIDGWALFLTVGIDHIGDLISMVCPALYNEKIPFSIIKDKKVAARKNDFLLGPDEVGKMLVVFTIDEQLTRRTIEQLTKLTKGLRGPSINKAIRVGEIIYVTRIKYVEEEDAEGNVKRVANIDNPDYRKLPFYIDPKFRYWKTKKLLKRRYVPLIMLNRSPKGDLLKAVDIKGFKFDWCFVKEGKYKMFEDRYGRTIKERLQWQAKVLQELYGVAPVPRFIDYFEQGEESYLVMEYLDGVDLYRKIVEIYGKRKWMELGVDERRRLFGYYLEVLEIVGKMHLAGYAHRDATAANFMILESGEVYTIDLELTYNFKRDDPNPPFGMGVFGYVAPEQILHQNPSVKEDIYTMGALLLHILTGKHPVYYIDKDNVLDIENVRKEVEVPELIDIILRCFDEKPEERPELEDLKQAVKSMLY